MSMENWNVLAGVVAKKSLQDKYDFVKDEEWDSEFKAKKPREAL